MGSQSSKAPRGDVTAEEAAGASPAKANGQENGHVKSNGDLTPKGEGESPPVNGTDEAAGATGDAIEPAPPSQEAEAKGEVAPKEKASAASKGGDTEEEAGPQAAEPSTPSGPESGPASASAEQNE
ncbi:MARCKS-related protein-like [Alexandromys fortis]|uniref:MARCKS-related protein-like n=1 Tax=Alexandromys fortis TaxID=100897 RepID=UPI0021531228|nr:MARCKS-related protein-like [Microtus fortis]